MNNNDFISKIFICHNYIGINEVNFKDISNFIQRLDGIIEIENEYGKKINDVYNLKDLNILDNQKVIIYCYGNNKEKNLMRIESFLYKIQLHTEEKIKNYDDDFVKEYIREEILKYSEEAGIKKEITDEDIALLRYKKEIYYDIYTHNSYLDIYNDIFYIENNDKTNICNIINENICNIINSIASFYELEINKSELDNFILKIIDIIKNENIKYFFIIQFFDEVEKYMKSQFYELFIKKLIGFNVLINYDIDFIKISIKDSNKTLEDVLKYKRNEAEHFIKFNYQTKLFDQMKTIEYLIELYELEESIINDILSKLLIKSKFVFRSSISFDTISNIRDYFYYFQEKFENYYISKLLCEKAILNIDFNYINKLYKKI